MLHPYCKFKAAFAVLGDNRSGAFEAGAGDAHRLAGRDILIVDGVLTTGATANECSRVLMKSRAESVKIPSIARTV